MSNRKRQATIIKEVQKRYGAVIDLKKSPGVLLKILRTYGRVFDDNGGGGTGSGGTGTGGTGGGTSTVAVGITPPEHQFGDQVSNEVILRTLLTLHRDVKVIGRNLAKKTKR